VADHDLPKGHVIRCPLTAADFYDKDGHQNEAGSKVIYNCVAQALTEAKE